MAKARVFWNESMRTFGRWQVINRVDRKPGTWLLCECECGVRKVLAYPELRLGRSKSCGCLAREILSKRRKSHGMSTHKLYVVWNDMKQRCFDKNVKPYIYYGGRGITVCDDWLDSSTFFVWALSNGWKEGLQLDRRDNDGNYSPDNCRFVTSNVNASNRGMLRSNKTGYAGVSCPKPYKKFVANVSHKFLGSFKTLEEALKARNDYILSNNLSYKIQEFKCE